MASKLETIIATLFNRLYLLNTTVQRNSGVPVDVPAGGLIILHDGESGQPEIMLSPLTYEYQHVVELDIYVQAATADEADRIFDVLRMAIGQVVTSDRTLGGLCHWAEAQAARPTNLPLLGTMPIKAATIPVELHFATSNPLA
jgi:hypothetical protein